MPLERLDRKRTGSIISRVGPAVTSTRLPAKSVFGWSASHAAAITFSGSDMRPIASSPQARCPLSGPTNLTPRAFSVARFCWLAALRYILQFIAGASSTGAVVAMAVVESRSSAMPQAILPIMLAVHGAISRRSAALASEICSISQVFSNELTYA